MAWVGKLVECLPSKLEALDMIPRAIKRFAKKAVVSQGLDRQALSPEILAQWGRLPSLPRYNDDCASRIIKEIL
jgi:hypothetical protein